MKNIDLGTTKTCEFGDQLIISLDKKWSTLNNGEPLEFQAKLENGCLVLRSLISGRQRNTDQSTKKEADTDVM